MSSPMSRPMTAVTNSAVESSSTRRMSQVAGTTVRYGRIAKPTTIQATTQAARSAPAYSDPVNKPLPVDARASPTTPPSAAPRTWIYRIKRLPRDFHRRPRAANGLAGRSA